MTERRNWPESMSVATAAEYLDCSSATVRDLIQSGGLRCHTLKRGGDLRIAKSELDRFILQRQMIGVEPRRGS